MENRIKEQQLALFADRTSTHEMHANQLRLYFSSFAYVLIQTLRRLALQGTALARAQCGTIRLKLLKVGVQVRISVRKVWLAFAESYPYAALFRQVPDPAPGDSTTLLARQACRESAGPVTGADPGSVAPGI